RGDILLTDAITAACEFLQTLVWLRKACAAKDRLDTFSDHGPLCIQVAFDRLFVQQKFTQAFAYRIDRHHRVRHWYADVARYGAVGKVALQAAHRQFFAQETEHRVGDAEIAFGILEIDRVHLVRHGAAADLTGLYPLTEIVHADVL